MTAVNSTYTTSLLMFYCCSTAAMPLLYRCYTAVGSLTLDLYFVFSANLMKSSSLFNDEFGTCWEFISSATDAAFASGLRPLCIFKPKLHRWHSLASSKPEGPTLCGNICCMTYKSSTTLWEKCPSCRGVTHSVGCLTHFPEPCRQKLSGSC